MTRFYCSVALYGSVFVLYPQRWNPHSDDNGPYKRSRLVSGATRFTPVVSARFDRPLCWNWFWWIDLVVVTAIPIDCQCLCSNIAVDDARQQQENNKLTCCFSRVVLYSPIATIKNGDNSTSWNRILLLLLLDLLTRCHSPTHTQQRLYRHRPNLLRSVSSFACFQHGRIANPSTWSDDCSSKWHTE